MTNRRKFLQTSLSVSALPFTTGLMKPGEYEGEAGSNIPVKKGIFDGRYAEGEAFAQTLSGFDVPLYELSDGDITTLWVDELDLLYRQKPVAIAGMTQFGPMFALEKLANEHGMQMMLRIDHQVRKDETIAHVIKGPVESIALAEKLKKQEVPWPALSAALLTHCRIETSRRIEQTVVTPGGSPAFIQETTNDALHSVIHYYTPQAIQEGHNIPWDGPLFSWVIAPVSKA